MGKKQTPNSVKGSRFWCGRRAGGHKRLIVIFELWGLKKGKRPPNRLRKRYVWNEPEIDS